MPTGMSLKCVIVPSEGTLRSRPRDHASCRDRVRPRRRWLAGSWAQRRRGRLGPGRRLQGEQKGPCREAESCSFARSCVGPRAVIALLSIRVTKLRVPTVHSGHAATGARRSLSGSRSSQQTGGLASRPLSSRSMGSTSRAIRWPCSASSRPRPWLSRELAAVSTTEVNLPFLTVAARGPVHFHAVVTRDQLRS